MKKSRSTGAVAAFGACLALCATAVSAQWVSVVEYHHAAFDHYFITSLPDEITKLDNGTFVGWKRTGQQFLAYPVGAAATVPTCRFFSTAFGPKSSHFYTPNAAECVIVNANPAWEFEGEVLGVGLPGPTGTCGAGTRPLYRLYNNGQGGAPNHRYTTDAATRSATIAKGWIAEGAGALGVIACVPSQVATAEGLWTGTSSTGANVAGFVLDTGVFYFIYTTPYSSIAAGVIQGNLTTAGASVTSSNARDFSFVAQGMYGATLSGSFAPRTSLTGAVASQLGQATFSLAYDATYETPANIADAAGVFVGTASTSLGNQQVTLNLGAGGVVTGSAPGCTFSGSAARHGNVNLYDLSIRFNGGQCLFGTATLTGIGYYDRIERRLHAVAPNAGRTDGFLFIGTKP